MGDQKESTPEQLAWDKKNAYYNRNLYLALGAWAVLLIGAFSWVIVNHTIPSVTAMTQSGSVPDGIDKFGGIGYLFGLVMVFSILAAPLQKVAHNVGWVMGSRPSDDYTPYVPKPIDIEWEQVSDDVRIAHVGKYSIEIKRYQYASILNRFRKPRWNHTLVLDDKVHYTLSYSLFTGKTEAEAEQYICDTISGQLEERTDYFKELNYSI